MPTANRVLENVSPLFNTWVGTPTPARPVWQFTQPESFQTQKFQATCCWQGTSWTTKTSSPWFYVTNNSFRLTFRSTHRSNLLNPIWGRFHLLILYLTTSERAIDNSLTPNSTRSWTITRHYLLAPVCRTPELYLPPKIYKDHPVNNGPTECIIFQLNSMYIVVGFWIHNIRMNLSHRNIRTVFYDGSGLSHDRSGLVDLSEGYKLTRLDVTNLYTNIDHTSCLKAATEPGHKPSISSPLELLHLVLTNQLATTSPDRTKVDIKIYISAS